MSGRRVRMYLVTYAVRIGSSSRMVPSSPDRCSHSAITVSRLPRFSLSELMLASSQLTKKPMASGRVPDPGVCFIGGCSNWLNLRSRSIAILTSSLCTARSRRVMGRLGASAGISGMACAPCGRKLTLGRCGPGSTGVTRILSTSAPNNIESVTPISVIPSRKRGQRFLVGSKNTGRTTLTAAFIEDWSTEVRSGMQKL